MILKRFEENPILIPNQKNSWEAEAVFNGSVTKKGNSIYLIYRALSLPHFHTLANRKMYVSSIGIAKSKDGIHFNNRSRFIVAEEEWEKFGCEDPRVTKFNNSYYIFYTALSQYPFNPQGIKIGLAISDDLKTIKEKHLITPFNAKGMSLFPEKINGKIWSILTVNTDLPPSKICLASFDSEEELYSKRYWNKWYKNFNRHSLDLKVNPLDHIETGSAPIKTKEGWLIFYSYIENYFKGEPLFGIKALLLDLNDPTKIISQTAYPILTPEEYYERIGLVPNVVFPSGALIKNDEVYLYYGAADTVCCLATVKLSSLLSKLLEKETSYLKTFERYNKNPILIPNPQIAWQAKAVFNPGAILLNNKVHLVYRAMSVNNTSVMGYATSTNGFDIDYNYPDPIYIPREDFEQKHIPNGNSGCEDPRLTKIGSRIYMCYTAYNGRDLPRVALTSITTKDFLSQNWNWEKPVLISSPEFDDKDACIFPEKINGTYWVVHRAGEDIDLGFPKTLNFSKGVYLNEYRWFGPRKGWWDSKKIGAAAPPIKTKDGWIMLYHGVSDNGIYRVGAVLLDLNNPLEIISRTDYPLFEPQEKYEKEGQVPNVVFPCGTVVLNDTLFMYYGGGDSVIGVATISLKDLLKYLRKCQ